MLFPIRSCRRIDRSRFLIENRLWITVAPHGTIHRLPNIVLLARTCMRSQRKLILVDRPRSDQSAPKIISFARLFHPHVRTFRVKRILIRIQIHICKSAKIHWIRTRRKRAVVMIRIKHLYRQRFPSAGRAAIRKPRPSLPNAAELSFQSRELVPSRSHLHTVRDSPNSPRTNRRNRDSRD